MSGYLQRRGLAEMVLAKASLPWPNLLTKIILPFILIVAGGVSGHRGVLLDTFLSPSHLSHFPRTRHARRGRAPPLPKAWLPPTWRTPPTSVPCLLHVPGRGSGGSVSTDVAAGGRGGRRGPGCTAGEDAGCGDAVVASPATGWGARARRSQRDRRRTWVAAGGAGMGVRPRRRCRCGWVCDSRGVARRGRGRGRGGGRCGSSKAVRRRAWSPRRCRSRGGLGVQPAARQRDGSSEPRVARIAAGDTVAMRTSRAR